MEHVVAFAARLHTRLTRDMERLWSGTTETAQYGLQHLALTVDDTEGGSGPQVIPPPRSAPTQGALPSQRSLSAHRSQGRAPH